jgi:hypothetical protein
MCISPASGFRLSSGGKALCERLWPPGSCTKSGKVRIAGDTTTMVSFLGAAHTQRTHALRGVRPATRILVRLSCIKVEMVFIRLQWHATSHLMTAPLFSR